MPSYKPKQRRTIWRSVFRVRKASFFVAAFLLATFTGVSLFRGQSEATILSLYPEVCLGSGGNPRAVEGKPNVNEAYDLFSETNSALIDPDTNGQLFCGNFIGEVPKDTLPKKAIVKFSWLVSNQKVEQTLDLLERNEPIYVDIKGNIEGATVDATEENTNTEEIPNTQEDAGTSIENTEVKEVNEVDTTISRLINWLVPKASAQERSEVEETFPEAVTEEEVVPKAVTEEEAVIKTIPEDNEESITTDKNDDLAAEDNKDLDEVEINENETKTTQIEEKFFLDPSAADPYTDFLEVSYTMDGQTWGSLGYVNESNWNTIEFEIPADKFFDWDDLSGLQIAVSTLPTLDTRPYVYIDNIALNISYESLEQIAKQAEKVKLRTDGIYEVRVNKFIKSTKNVFSGQETPTFEIEIQEFDNFIENTPNKTQLILDEEEENLDNTDTQGENTDDLELPDIPKESTENITEIIEEDKQLDSPLSSSHFWGFLKNKLLAVSKSNIAHAESGQARIIKASTKSLVYGETADNLAAIIQNPYGQNPRVIILKKDNTFRPGKYILEIEIEKNGKYYLIEKEFEWGTVIVNLNKRDYFKGEAVFINIIELGENGSPLCIEKLHVLVTKPDNETIAVTNNNYDTPPEESCLPTNLIGRIKHEFVFGETIESGDYHIKINDQENINLAEEIFTVKDKESKFIDIERSLNNSIDTNNKISTNSLTISTNPKSYNFSVVEEIPSSIEIIDIEPAEIGKVKNFAGKTYIVWELAKLDETNIDKEENENYEDELIYLSYNFTSENREPLYFAFGPATIFKQNINLRNALITKKDAIFSDKNIYQVLIDIEQNNNKKEEVEKSDIDLPSRTITKEFQIDKEAIHICKITPFLVDVSGLDQASVEIALDSEKGDYELEIGSLPAGIDIRFTKNNDFIYSPSSEENNLDLKISILPEAQKGDFTIPIIYTKNKSKETESVTICQLNIINRK